MNRHPARSTRCATGRLLAGCILLLAAAALPCSVAPGQLAETQPTEAAPTDPLEAERLKLAARAALRAANPQQARQHLRALAGLYRPDPQQPLGETELRHSARKLCAVALECLRSDLLADASQLLGEAAELVSPEGRHVAGSEIDEVGSAAAGWNRRLAALDAADRFDLLREWTMPTETRAGLRVLTAITPVAAPPATFARLLGERPRDGAFAAPEIGGVRGLFCSAWELARAADEAGSMRRLTAELTRLADDRVENARFVLTLVRIVSARREDDQLADDLGAHADAIAARDAIKAVAAAAADKQETPPVSADEFLAVPESTADIALAAACLTQPWLLPLAEQHLKLKLEQTYGADSPVIRPLLRGAYATAIGRRREASDDLAAGSELDLWDAASGPSAWGAARGAAPSVWLARDDHLLHWTGRGDDLLFFKYPLTGDFEFSCDAQLGGPRGADGGLAYAGLGYEVWGEGEQLRVRDASARQVVDMHCPFVASHRLATFNRLSLRSTADRVIFSANRHAVWGDDSQDPTAPWIGLRAFADRVPIFRNLQISGEPVIPRAVNLLHEDSLRSWVAAGRRLPEEAAKSELQLAQRRGRFVVVTYDWSASEGVLHGARRAAASEQVAQSWIAYVRPLQNGESINYEFQYDPGVSEVHPTLGRIAMLIEPEGVRIHWLTDGDREWTGLAEDNAVVEPLNRRGPRPLPLRPGEWNRAVVALQSDTLTLSLNDAAVYSWRLAPDSDRRFGFYHDKSHSAASVRKVVLRGDWPERLTASQLKGLLTASDSQRSLADRRAVGAIFDDQHLHGSVLSAHLHAAGLPARERYEYLANWVLPGADHETLRLALDFTPTNPAPPRPDSASRGAPARSTSGGELVSPAIDLVASAKELGRLKTLRQQVAGIEPPNDEQRRSRLAMLALIDIAAGDLTVAKQSLDELILLVAANGAQTFSDRWPETLAIWASAELAATRDSAREMVLQVHVNQIRKYRSSGYDPWEQQIRAVESRIRYFDLLDREPALSAGSQLRLSGQSPLDNWIPTSHETTRTRGMGFPRAVWERPAAGVVENFASHDEDYLFYRLPLRGDFEVECDVSGFGYRETNLWVAGRWVGPVYTNRHVDEGMFRKRLRLPLDPPLHKTEDWIRYRAVIRGGVCTTYFNGRQGHVRALEPEHDPWLAIHSYFSTCGAVRNLRIIGNPQIPREVRLTVNDELPGWLPVNHGHGIGPRRKWQKLGDLESGGGIRGIRWSDSPGSNQEALVRYHRPMAEDGEIEYEFYYREGELQVHPALDRLAFMLQPDGVRAHWVTDDQFDRTGLAPDNLVDEPECRRGPEKLPLKSDAWNRMQLALSGDTVRLSLNGELVYERGLESSNQRTFGLFHYADRGEAIVRNVVWRGDWPRVLPAPLDQELAGEESEELDATLDELTAVFEHDFVRDGLDLRRFGLNSGDLAHFKAEADGVRATRLGGPHYAECSIAPLLRISGDFDITVEFDQFEPNPSQGGSSGIYLQAILDNDKANECMIYRRHLRNKAEAEPIVQGSYVTREAGGARRLRFPWQIAEAKRGRFRLARRGDTAYFLFAENDSPRFQMLGKQTAAATDDVLFVKLMTQTHLEGQTTVVWKRLQIRAAKLSGLALQNQKLLLAELNKRRDALPQGFTHDFATAPMKETHFQPWGQFQPPDENGVRVVSVGTDRWTSTGFNSRAALVGDFDASLTFDELKFAAPKKGLSCALYLQVEFPDEAQTQANIIFDENNKLYAQVRVIDSSGKSHYRRILAAEAEGVEALRLARRGKTISYLYRVKGADEDRLLAQHEILDVPLPPSSLRLLFHTGGDDRQSEAVLKQFTLRAEKTGLEPDVVPAEQPPGLLESIRNFFRPLDPSP